MLSPLHLILVHAVFSSQPTLRHRGRCPSHSSLFPLLKSVLIKPGSPADRYSAHSFRIGAPTTAGNISLSKQQIKMLGSWCSDAYQSYIRPVSRPPSIGSNADFPPIAASDGSSLGVLGHCSHAISAIGILRPRQATKQETRHAMSALNQASRWVN